MNKQPVAQSWESNVAPFVFACVGIHLASDFLLIRRAWFLETDRMLVAMALPLSQCSLVAIWAVSSRAKLPLRFAIPALVAMFCWYVLSQILPWGIGEPASAAWAIALIIQIIATVIAIRLYRLVDDVIARRKSNGDAAGGSHMTFDLATLMLWSTVVACGFGFMQFGRDHWGWGANVANWECLHAMPVIGIFNALLAALWLWALTLGRWQWRMAKLVIVAVIVASTYSLLSGLIGWIGGNCGLEPHQSRTLLTAQSVFLLGSLAMILVGVFVRKSDTAVG